MSHIPAQFVRAKLSTQMFATIQSSIQKARTPTGLALRPGYAPPSGSLISIVDNGQQMATGVAQVHSVTPKSVLVADNKARVGVYKHYSLDENVIEGSEHFGHLIRSKAYQRRVVRIYQPDIRVMQNTPRIPRGGIWVIEFEPWAVFKSPYMGWGRATSDMYYRWQIRASTLYALVDFAKRMGWGYEIDYPKERWTIRKSYADNYKWKGKHKPDLSQDFQ